MQSILYVAKGAVTLILCPASCRKLPERFDTILFTQIAGVIASVSTV